MTAETRKTFRAVMSAPKLVIPTSAQPPAIVVDANDTSDNMVIHDDPPRSTSEDSTNSKKRTRDETFVETTSTPLNASVDSDRKKKKRKNRDGIIK